MNAAHASPTIGRWQSRAFGTGVRSGQDFSLETRLLFRARDGTYRWHLQQAAGCAMRKDKSPQIRGYDNRHRRPEARRGEIARNAGRSCPCGAGRHTQRHDGVHRPRGEPTLVGGPDQRQHLRADAGCRSSLFPPAPPKQFGERSATPGGRASDVVQRLRAMYSAKAPTMEAVDLNDAAREVITLSARELQRGGAGFTGEIRRWPAAHKRRSSSAAASHSKPTAERG